MFNREALKLVTTADELARVKQALLDMATRGPESRTVMTSTYYDTATNQLRREGLVLSVHEQNRRFIQAIRGYGSNAAECPASGEWEDVIAAEQLDLRAPNISAHLPQALDQSELQPRFRTVVQRTLLTLEPEESIRIEGTVDEGEIATVDGDRTEPISEVALELKHGDPGALHAIALRLLEVASLRIEISSEAERGYSLLEPALDTMEVRSSPPFRLKADMTVEETLGRVGWACLVMLLRNERATLAGVPEGVHQMRVAVRRLRSAVNLIKRMLPNEQYQWVSQELKWLANVLGPARN